LVEETGVPGENHLPVTSHWQTLSHNLLLLPVRSNVVSVLALSVPDDGYYRNAYLIIYLCFYYYHSVDAVGLLIPEGTIRSVVSALHFLKRYI
jgi:hypothetical protein